MSVQWHAGDYDVARCSPVGFDMATIGIRHDLIAVNSFAPGEANDAQSRAAHGDLHIAVGLAEKIDCPWRDACGVRIPAIVQIESRELAFMQHEADAIEIASGHGIARSPIVAPR